MSTYLKIQVYVAKKIRLDSPGMLDCGREGKVRARCKQGVEQEG